MLRFKNHSSVGFVLRFALALGCIFTLGRQGIASGASVKDANQGVIQAINLLEGDRLFDNAVEVYSRKTADGSVTVTFRRPTSDRIVSAGRLANKPLFTVSFKNDKVAIQKYEKNKMVVLNKRPQASQKDRKLARIVTSALAYLWKNKTSESKDVAISVGKFTYKNKKTFLVIVTRIPYVPDGFVSVEVSADGKAISSHAAP